jgi:hypothetical protein
MTRTTSSFLGVANFAMAATPLVAALVAVLAPLAR